MRKSRLQYYTHRGRRGHPSSIAGRLGSHILLPFLLVVLATFVVTGAFFVPLSPQFLVATQVRTLLGALGASLLRLLLA